MSEPLVTAVAENQDLHARLEAARVLAKRYRRISAGLMNPETATSLSLIADELLAALDGEGNSEPGEPTESEVLQNSIDAMTRQRDAWADRAEAAEARGRRVRGAWAEDGAHRIMQRLRLRDEWRALFDSIAALDGEGNQ